MVYSIKLRSLEGNMQWEKKFVEPSEFDKVRELFSLSGRIVQPHKALINTIRTHTAKAFLKDFFIPTCAHQALKVNDFAIKCFWAIPCLVIDMLTLPIRAITLVPSSIRNLKYMQQAQPLREFLEKEGAPQNCFKSKPLLVDFYYEGGPSLDSPYPYRTEDPSEIRQYVHTKVFTLYNRIWNIGDNYFPIHESLNCRETKI